MNCWREAIEAAQTPEELQAILAAEGSSPRWTVPTLTEVAEFFGVATSTVKGWRMDTPAMPGTDGSYPLPEIVRWRHARLTQSDLATEKKRQDLELGKVQLEQKRLGLAKERAELVLLADCERWAATALIESPNR